MVQTAAFSNIRDAWVNAYIIIDSKPALLRRVRAQQQDVIMLGKRYLLEATAPQTSFFGHRSKPQTSPRTSTYLLLG